MDLSLDARLTYASTQEAVELRWVVNPHGAEIRNEIVPSIADGKGTMGKLVDIIAVDGDPLRDFCSAPCGVCRS